MDVNVSVKENVIKEVKEEAISDNLTQIKYVRNVAPYYYFQLTDPDRNVIEVTSDYVPTEAEDGGMKKKIYFLFCFCKFTIDHYATS